MNYVSELELCMRNALLENDIFFDEQVYVRTKTSFYIFDFVVYGEYCKIIVECDGPYHYHLEKWFLDSRRDLWSIQNGYQDILRFSAPQIAKQIDLCIKKIKNTIKSYDKALEMNSNLKGIIRSERQQISLRHKSQERNSIKSKYSELRVKINDPEENIKEVICLNSNQTVIHSENSSEKGADILNRIPESEKRIWNTMRGLPKEQKRLLWRIIKKSNMLNLTVYGGPSIELSYLIGKKLVGIIPYSRPRKDEVCVCVLDQAPCLLQILKGESN